MPDDQDPRARRPEDEHEAIELLVPRDPDAEPELEDADLETPAAAEGIDEEAFEDDTDLAIEDEPAPAPSAFADPDADEDAVETYAPLTEAPLTDRPEAPLAWTGFRPFDADEPEPELEPEVEPTPPALLYPDSPGEVLEEDEDVVEAIDEYLDEEEAAYEAYEETPTELAPLAPRIATEAPPAAPPPTPIPYAPPLPADLEPMVPLTPVATDTEAAAQAEETIEEEHPLSRRRAIPINALVVVMTAIGTAICLGFLLIEPSPRWLLLAGAIVVIFGMDGVLRGTWGEPFASEGDTTPYLFLPALYILAGPMIVEHNIPGYYALPAGLLLGVGFGVIVVGELISVRTGAPEYPIARLIETVASYFVLFSLISMTYVFDINLTMAMLAIGILTLMLAIEVLRQGEIDPIETLLLAIVTALILVQARWLMHYLPIDGYLAGLTLTLVFFLTTGLLHAYVERQFDNALVLEYATIAAAGIALVAAARFTGLA